MGRKIVTFIASIAVTYARESLKEGVKETALSKSEICMSEGSKIGTKRQCGRRKRILS